MKVAALAALLAVSAGCAARTRTVSRREASSVGAPVEPERPGQADFLKRGVFSEGTLWLLSDAGVLYRVRETEADSAAEDVGGVVLDICLRGNTLVALTCRDRDDCEPWTIRSRLGNSWRVDGTVLSINDQVLGMGCQGDVTTMVTTNRLIDVDGVNRHAVPMSTSIQEGSVTSIDVEAGRVFVADNRGEWGGSLRAIDRTTGAVTEIGREDFNAVVQEPWRPEMRRRGRWSRSLPS